MLNIILYINSSDKDNQMSMEPGIYDISNEAYHQGPGKNLSKTKCHFIWVCYIIVVINYI